MQEVYVSVDIETDGPIPGPHSMLSLGAAALTRDGKMLSTFTRNLELLPGAEMHPKTRKFWDRNLEAYAATRSDLVSPEVAMRDFVLWSEVFPEELDLAPVFVGYPAGFDFTFMYWYMMKFVGRSPYSFSALDMKSYAMAKLDKFSFRGTTKRTMPGKWFQGLPKHTHVAIDDAIEQGQLFINMLKD